MVFIEGEALIFRMSDMRLQPKDIFAMCSLDDQCPKGTTIHSNLIFFSKLCKIEVEAKRGEKYQRAGGKGTMHDL
jgi:hypothetical protein